MRQHVVYAQGSTSRPSLSTKEALILLMRALFIRLPLLKWNWRIWAHFDEVAQSLACCLKNACSFCASITLPLIFSLPDMNAFIGSTLLSVRPTNVSSPSVSAVSYTHLTLPTIYSV